ncbi:MAG TPA: hypothetical protein VFR73_10640 [Hyphomicrobiaceae bacterium]|nr:hypothetical protein [Hyphomicrobiaceae bacterium]
MLLLIGMPLLGAWTVLDRPRSILLFAWPRTKAVILRFGFDLRQTTSTLPGSDEHRGGRTETREAATLHGRYRVAGRAYQAERIEPVAFGLQTSDYSLRAELYQRQSIA